MKVISASELIEKISRLVVETNIILSNDCMSAFNEARLKEESPSGKKILSEIIENARVAKELRLPLCQDTGIFVFFIELGEDVRVDGAGLFASIREGAKRGFRDGYLRASMVDPLTRKNTGDNTPPIIHLQFAPGKGLKIDFLAKGCGAENMSRLFMLPPATKRDEIINKVVGVVEDAGARSCPPLVIGVGIGGSFDLAPILAKRALLCAIGKPHVDSEIASLESEVLTRINGLGIGPMGLGGRVTALAVHIETYPCHIASLPLAVNLQCHSIRHGRIEF